MTREGRGQAEPELQQGLLTLLLTVSQSECSHTGARWFHLVRRRREKKLFMLSAPWAWNSPQSRALKPEHYSYVTLSSVRVLKTRCQRHRGWWVCWREALDDVAVLPLTGGNLVRPKPWLYFIKKTQVVKVADLRRIVCLQIIFISLYFCVTRLLWLCRVESLRRK